MIHNQYRYDESIETHSQITTVQAYELAETKFNAWKAETEGRIAQLPPVERFPYYYKITAKYGEMVAGLCPDVLVSICPYCGRNVWARMRNGLFTLNSWFWVMEYDNGKTVTDDSLCEHLFLVDGALGLNSQPVLAKIKPYSFVREKIYMGAEVPFVKPRILDKPGVIGVLHSVPVAGKYTGYPVTYFTKTPIRQSEFGTGWSREESCARDDMVSEATFSGSRQEIQIYDVEPYALSGKLKWLVQKENELVLNHSASEFPYGKIQGRKNPYIIKNGTVTDLPNPTKEILQTTIETFMPG